jgi:hypothetical protein
MMLGKRRRLVNGRGVPRWRPPARAMPMYQIWGEIGPATKIWGMEWRAVAEVRRTILRMMRALAVNIATP